MGAFSRPANIAASDGFTILADFPKYLCAAASKPRVPAPKNTRLI